METLIEYIIIGFFLGFSVLGFGYTFGRSVVITLSIFIIFLICQHLAIEQEIQGEIILFSSEPKDAQSRPITLGRILGVVWIIACFYFGADQGHKHKKINQTNKDAIETLEFYRTTKQE